MGDSGDDDYNSNSKRGRDKFQRERRDESNNYNYSQDDRYNEKNNNMWKYKQNPSNQSNYQYHQNQPQMYQRYPSSSFNDYQRRYNSTENNNSPPVKRRKEWDSVDNNSYPQSYLKDSSSHNNSHNSSRNNGNERFDESPTQAVQKESEGLTQPPYISFKQFLQQQDDSISEEEAIKKYNNYRIEFKKTQINQFFLDHKEEQWFKARYFPDDSEKRFAEQKKAIRNRLLVFIEMYRKGFLDNVVVEVDKFKDLLRFLNSAIIKMEGGNDEDLKSLDEENDKKQKKISEKKDTSSGESGDNSDDSDEGDSSNRGKRSKNSETMKNTPRALHRNTSIFLGSLPSSITEKDLEEIFKEIEFSNGNVKIKRIALSDPCPERGFLRRCWITFEQDVNAKSFCWSLNNHKIRGFNPGAIVNKDLPKPVIPATVSTTNYIYHHKSCVQNDIKIARKIVEKFDERWQIWKTTEDKGEEEYELSGNPLLENTHEISKEEIDEQQQENPFQNDLEMKKVLDKLILYLRVVYSFDFYNNIEYQQEDLMPNRIGIIHARPSIGNDEVVSVKKEDISAYNRSVEANMKPFIEFNDKLDEETAKKLGLKNKDDELEKFVEKNTQELAPDRWLCPLSGKKFKGPEFIRKHLFYKHEDKVNEVKKDVDFFNNFLNDPKRPQLPEHPLNRSQQSTSAMQNSPLPRAMNNFPSNNRNSVENFNQLHSSPFYGGNNLYQIRSQNIPTNNFNYSRFPNPHMKNFYGGGGGSGNGGGADSVARSRHSREIITYKDLDAAPSEG